MRRVTRASSVSGSPDDSKDRDLARACWNPAPQTHWRRVKTGLVVVSSAKKKPFLTDKSFFVKHGFQVCDTAPPYFELLVRPFRDAPLPTFRPNARTGAFAHAKDLAILYTDQCPFTGFYLDEMVEVAAEYGLSAEKIKLTTTRQVQDGPSPFGVSGVYLRGQFLTHEIMTRKSFAEVLSKALG